MGIFIAGILLCCLEYDLEKRGKGERPALYRIGGAMTITSIALCLAGWVIFMLAKPYCETRPLAGWQLFGVGSALLGFVSFEALFVLTVYVKPQARAYLRTNTGWNDISSKKAKRITWKKVWAILLIVSFIGYTIVPLIWSHI